jgi:hypothetical protein
VTDGIRGLFFRPGRRLRLSFTYSLPILALVTLGVRPLRQALGRRILALSMHGSNLLTHHRSLCVGIDFSGNHRMWSAGCGNSNVWIAEVERSSPRPVLVSLKRVQQLNGERHPFDRLIRYLRDTDFDAAAIDAPFSVPAEYLQPRTHSELLELIGKAKLIDGRPFPCAREFVDLVLGERTTAIKKPLRRTEEYWQARGVNVRSTLWAGARGGAPMTAACLKLLYEAGRPIWPWKKRGRGLLAEAFPAAQLRNWKLPYQGYSRQTDCETKTRCSIVAAISKSVNLARFRDTVEQSADALDAVICAFGAIAVTAERIVSYAEQNRATEGLIAVHRFISK